MSDCKRQPIAEVGAEGYRIVRHTHDVPRAVGLMRALLIEHDGCGEGACGVWPKLRSVVCLHKRDVGKPVQEWIRIVPALPNSYAADEGWAFTYQPTRPHARGAFPAVVFW